MDAEGRRHIFVPVCCLATGTALFALGLVIVRSLTAGAAPAGGQTALPKNRSLDLVGEPLADRKRESIVLESGPHTFEKGLSVALEAGPFFFSRGTTVVVSEGARAIDSLVKGSVTYEGDGRVTIPVEGFGTVTVGNAASVTVKGGELRLRSGRAEAVYDLALGAGRLHPGYTLVAADRLTVIPPKRLEHYNPLNTSVVIDNRTATAMEATVFATRGGRTDRVGVTVPAGRAKPTYWRSPSKVGIDHLVESSPGASFEIRRAPIDEENAFAVDGIKPWTRVRLVVSATEDGYRVSARREALPTAEVPMRTKQWGAAQERFNAQVVVGNDTPYTIKGTLYAVGVYREGRDHTEGFLLPPASDHGPRDLFSPPLVVVGDANGGTTPPEPTVTIIDDDGRVVGRRPGIRLDDPPHDKTTYVTFAGKECTVKVEHEEMFRGALHRVALDQVSE